MKIPNLNVVAGLRIALASPEQIRSWSSGGVSSSDTINYLTHIPERDGLFCERIFGPLKDWTCTCGIRRSVHDAGNTCQKCGVEVALSQVRRERMGHIELAVPVAHSWFAHSAPSIMATLLAISPRQLAGILSYTDYLVETIDEDTRRRYLDEPRETTQKQRRQLVTLTVGSVLDGIHDQEFIAQYGACFQLQTGGEAILTRLRSFDQATLTTVATSLRHTINRGQGDPKKAIKRLRVVEAFHRSGIHPAWMMLDVIPVLPPDLRPLVHMGGGRFATSDVNLLYERVLHRNARIKRFTQQGAPDAIIRYEKRLLKDACDALFDNARCARPVIGADHQPLKSLTDSLKGKQGRFRHNLLGKRVDYSGRSVICVGLDLRLHECGLPKKIALELFKPFVIAKLLDHNQAKTPRAAKRLIERRHPCIWDLLAQCMHEKVVLLNRAPTLHRLSIQAFEPLLVEGDAIRLHPLVCSAFNADFDGDQMAVHLPLSHEAQAEARRLMLSIRNLRSPASGEPAISLSQEIVLGCFYLTEERPGQQQTRHVFVDTNEAELAYHHGVIAIHTPITVRMADEHIYHVPPPTPASPPQRGRIETTVGRLLFNAVLPESFGYRNYPMTKECLKQLITESLACAGEEATAQLADAIKQLGYHFATKSGISFAMSDMQEPREKQTLIAQGQATAQELQHDYHNGMINEEERDQRIIALWTEVTEQISDKLLALLDPYGTISTIVKSGATKAKFQQIRQLSGMRGLMANPSGRIIPIPVLSNYLTGLKTWEVFIAASGARKGFMDRSLNTAQSGYLTRKLVEVGMEVWTTQDDCGTHEGWLITHEESQARGLANMGSRIVGRVLAESVGDLAARTLLDEQHVEQLLNSGITQLRVRSPFTCQASYGICCRCYGRDLSTGKLVKRGVAVGIIAGQSIGEPGTQLTMRTFHSGGIANAQGDITQGLPRVIELFEARTPKHAALLAEVEGIIQIDRQEGRETTKITIMPSHVSTQSSEKLITYRREPGQSLLVHDGQQVTRGTPLTSGACNPKHLLTLQGRESTARYLINEVQRVYRGTGVYINDKHIEAIVRQMLRSVQIANPGDTTFLPQDILDRFDVIDANRRILAQGGTPAIAHPVLLGLTKTALHTASWIAAASFQETSRVLMQAAMRGQVDMLRGFKERVVLGERIPSS